MKTVDADKVRTMRRQGYQISEICWATDLEWDTVVEILDEPPVSDEN